MDIVAEQCVVIKYCVCRGKIANKTLSELKEAYGDECLTKSTVLKWHAIFVKDPSAVPVCTKPVGQPCSQIKGPSDALFIETVILNKLIVKKIILKLVLVILNKVQKSSFVFVILFFVVLQGVPKTYLCKQL